MIKIIEIKNYHQWDNEEVTEKMFDDIIKALSYGKLYYYCSFEQNGVKKFITNQRRIK